MSELKKCPFCGSDNLQVEERHKGYECWVVCDNCNSSGSTGPSRQKAIDAWNRRAEDE